jgi:hypothetical protein
LKVLVKLIDALMAMNQRKTVDCETLEEDSLAELAIEVFLGKMGRESQLQKHCHVQQAGFVRQNLEARGCWRRLAGLADPSL